MVVAGGGSVDVIFCGESTVGLVVVAGSFWSGEGITYGKSDRSGIDGDGGGFVVDISDIDGDIGFGRESRGAVVCNFDTESDGLMFLVV